MKLVIDASVAVKWFVEEAYHEEATAISESNYPLIAPDIIFAEVANVLRRKVRTGQIGHEQAAGGVRNLADAFRELLPSAGLVSEAFENASMIDHSVYDVIYLTCALREPGNLLITADAKFEAKAVAAGFGNKVLSLEAAYIRLLKAQENENG